MKHCSSEVVHRCNCLKSVVISDHTKQYCRNIAFSLTWPASMLIYWKKRKFYIRKEFNSHRIVLVHQYGRRSIVLEHQYGRRDVM